MRRDAETRRHVAAHRPHACQTDRLSAPSRHHLVFGNPTPQSLAGVAEAAEQGKVVPAIGRIVPLSEAISAVVELEGQGPLRESLLSFPHDSLGKVRDDANGDVACSFRIGGNGYRIGVPAAVDKKIRTHSGRLNSWASGRQAPFWCGRFRLWSSSRCRRKSRWGVAPAAKAMSGCGASVA